MDSSNGHVQRVANADFAFPANPETPVHTGYHGPRRTASLHLNPTTPQRATNLERRSASTLPTFTFNAADVSGRAESPDHGQSAASEAPSSASSRMTGHRRGVSELVGGAGLISTSPARGFDSALTPGSAPQFGSPVRKRGHAHRRSAAVSAHDLQTVLQPRDTNIITSQIEEMSPQPEQQPFGPVIGMDKAPESNTPFAQQSSAPRPRVGFSRNVEIIPRPLSTISSEAESIVSMSLAQSPIPNADSPPINSSSSPTMKRRSRSARSSLSEMHMAPKPRSSLEVQIPAPVEETEVEAQVSEGTKTAKRSSNFRDFSFPPRRPRAHLERRSSEPSLPNLSIQKPRRSSISLRDTLQPSGIKRSDSKMGRIVRKSSASRVKAWASGFMHRKDRKAKPEMTIDFADLPAPATPITDLTPASEPDLEELFSQDPFSQADDGDDDDNEPKSPLSSRFDVDSLRNFNPTWASTSDAEPVIDLDAAFGPSMTPSRDGRSPGFGVRRQLHSSRMNRDFASPGNLYHRRAESAPALAPFDIAKSPSPMHSPMADVFEEEEEEEASKAPVGSMPTSPPVFSFPQSPADHEMCNVQDDGLGIQTEQGTDTAPALDASHANSDAPNMGDAVMEDAGLIDIVEAHEEPRASMITKSSDSSDATTTIMADPVLTLAPPPSEAPFVSPSTYTGSDASGSPEIARRQSSFELPRLGTSASSATDCRTISSFASERPMDARASVDDVPSLTSSRSTMISTLHPSRREISDRASSLRLRQISEEERDKRRRKRTSIQSLTKLMSGPFSESRNRLNLEHGNASSPNLSGDQSSSNQAGRRKEHRLSRLMFWRSKGSGMDMSPDA